MKLLTLLNKLSEDAPMVDMSDEARMARAQAMGFDTSQIWYHGSPQRDLISMDPSAPKNANTVGDIEGLYFTTEPATASGYSRPRSSWGQAGRGGPKPPRGQIYSVYLRMQNPLDITDAIKKLARRKGVTFSDAKQIALQDVDRSVHDGVMFRGNAMNTPEAIVFDQKNVRSIDAPFVTSDSPFLMASLGESQMEDDYKRGYEEGRVKGLEDGRGFYANWDHSSDTWTPKHTGFHNPRGRVTKANAYETAFNYGYQDGYYSGAIGEGRLNEVRGPHQGRELKLMLAGKKKFAMIELETRSGEREAWEAAVASGKIKHINGIDAEGGHNDYFVLPGEEWRADVVTEIYRDVVKTNNMTAEHHTLLGQMLGYSDADIKHFVTGRDEHGDVAYCPSRFRVVGESERPAPRVAYHATFPDNRDNIRMHGLDPKYSDTFEEGAVFFATGGTPDPRMDIWKADLRGLDVEYDPTQEGGDNEHWWYTHQLIVPDRLKLVQKGTG